MLVELFKQGRNKKDNRNKGGKNKGGNTKDNRNKIGPRPASSRLMKPPGQQSPITKPVAKPVATKPVAKSVAKPPITKPQESKSFITRYKWLVIMLSIFGYCICCCCIIFYNLRKTAETVGPIAAAAMK